MPAERFPAVFGADQLLRERGIRFVEETCKMRAFVDLWERIGRERYGVTDEKALRFRYGVQVNSLGLHGGAAREQRAADRPRSARRHAVAQGQGPLLQLPAWNEALGLPFACGTSSGACASSRSWPTRPTSSSTPTFDGSHVVEARSPPWPRRAWAELEDVLALGGAFEAIDEFVRLVRSHTERMR